MFAAMYNGRNTFWDFAANPENKLASSQLVSLTLSTQCSSLQTNVNSYIHFLLSVNWPSFGDCRVFIYLPEAFLTFADEVTSSLKGLLLNRDQQVTATKLTEALESKTMHDED